jgi:membrane protease subunit HflK
MASKNGAILHNSGPWGGRPQGNNDGKPGDNNHGAWRPKGNDPDLDSMMRDAQDKVRRMFGNRGPSGAPKGGVGLLVLALLAIWLATGFYRVQPSEHAVILTFGKWTDTRTEPGLGWRAPWPMQDVEKVDIALDRRISIGYRADAPARSGQDMTEPSSESLMLTGDENIISINFVVLWRVNDAGKYLFRIRDPETTVKKVAESAMREIIGRTQIQKALTEGRGDIEARTRELMQKMLDDYHSGIGVNGVQMQRVDPPAPVVDAFDDVQRARADRERLRNEAQTYANDIVPRARGDVQKKLQDAEGYKQAVISKAEGDAKRFLSVYAAYKESKDVTEKRIYIETMQEILQNSKKVIVGNGSGPGVVPYLPLDQLKGGKK